MEGGWEEDKGGGGGEKKKRGEEKERLGKMRGNSSRKAGDNSHCLLVNTCSFLCTPITSWHVEFVASCPCLLPELSSTDLSICV